MPSDRSKTKDPVSAFRAHLGEIRREVDARLAGEWERALAELRPHGDAVLHMAGVARDLTMRGGKRFRAAMLVAAFAGLAPRASIDPALTAAVALELLQSYLLAQDDWMDGDPVRRGGPSAHAALAEYFGDAHRGAASAMLAGDLTWGLAVRTLAGARVKPERRLRAIEVFCAVHQDVVAGQQLDMLGSSKDVEAMHQFKTGSYTVRGPLVLGATLAGGSKRALAALRRYAAPLGVAFQLRDDLLGAFAPEAETGKREGGDLRAGKRTAVIAAAEALLSAEGRAALDRAFGHPESTDADVREATRALVDCGARAAVEERLRALCEEAAALAGELPVSDRSRKIFTGAALAMLPG
jgi:geranylgeranyl diphosphate synthase type I